MSISIPIHSIAPLPDLDPANQTASLSYPNPKPMPFPNRNPRSIQIFPICVSQCHVLVPCQYATLLQSVVVPFLLFLRSSQLCWGCLPNRMLSIDLSLRHGYPWIQSASFTAQTNTQEHAVGKQPQSHQPRTLSSSSQDIGIPMRSADEANTHLDHPARPRPQDRLYSQTPLPKTLNTLSYRPGE